MSESATLHEIHMPSSLSSEPSDIEPEESGSLRWQETGENAAAGGTGLPRNTILALHLRVDNGKSREMTRPANPAKTTSGTDFMQEPGLTPLKGRVSAPAGAEWVRFSEPRTVTVRPRTTWLDVYGAPECHGARNTLLVLAARTNVLLEVGDIVG